MVLQTNNQDQIKRSIQSDHEIIANAVVNFHLLFDRTRTPEADRELATVQHLFQAKIVKVVQHGGKHCFHGTTPLCDSRSLYYKKPIATCQ